MEDCEIFPVRRDMPLVFPEIGKVEAVKIIGGRGVKYSPAVNVSAVYSDALGMTAMVRRHALT